MLAGQSSQTETICEEEIPDAPQVNSQFILSLIELFVFDP